MFPSFIGLPLSILFILVGVFTQCSSQDYKPITDNDLLVFDKEYTDKLDR
jgi:hypothetical protein